MKKLILSAMLVAASSLVAHATQVLPGPETPLQTILNNAIVGPHPDVNANQVVGDSYWVADQNPAAYLIIEVAGYAGSNTFGIYQYGSPSTKVQIFSGNVSGPSGPTTVVVPSGWSSFGFYLGNTEVNPNFTWYSDPTLNGGGDHFVSFQGTNGSTLNSATFDSNDYVLAIEDLNLGDQDYNDMVVLVQNVSPAPVPDNGLTVALLGFSMCGVFALRRKLAVA